MQNEEFTEIVRNRLNICHETLAGKNKEYSSETDRLHNFKLAADIDGEEPVQALWGMFKKHLVSIIDIKNNPNVATKDRMDEKFTDAINYLLLMEALLIERNRL